MFSIFTTMKSNNITSYFEFSIFLMKRILNRKLEFPIYLYFECFVLILILPVGLKRREISTMFLSRDQVGLKVSSDFEYDTMLLNVTEQFVNFGLLKNKPKIYFLSMNLKFLLSIFRNQSLRDPKNCYYYIY